MTASATTGFAPAARLTVADMMARLADAGPRFAIGFTHGSLVVELYAPRGTDPQKPHTRDEVYVVVSGTGSFFAGGRRQDFGPGDLLFVPAGMEHRFEDFTDDLMVWVIFYGPEGGEGRREGGSE
jgi:mannose-6-phosphate isomerase-like protein (cupin superfamily)